MFGNAEQFQQAVHCLYRGWTALRLAVEHYEGRGNPEEKATCLENDTVNFFATTRSEINVGDVEDCLENFFNDEFNTLIEDGSIEEIARKLIMFYHLVRSGDETTFRNELNRLPAAALLAGSVAAPTGEDEGMDSDEEMLEEQMGNLGLSEPSNANTNVPMSSPDCAAPSVSSSRHVRSEPDEDGFITVTSSRNRTRKS